MHIGHVHYWIQSDRLIDLTSRVLPIDSPPSVLVSTRAIVYIHV